MGGGWGCGRIPHHIPTIYPYTHIPVRVCLSRISLPRDSLLGTDISIRDLSAFRELHRKSHRDSLEKTCQSLPEKSYSLPSFWVRIADRASHCRARPSQGTVFRKKRVSSVRKACEPLPEGLAWVFPAIRDPSFSAGRYALVLRRKSPGKGQPAWKMKIPLSRKTGSCRQLFGETAWKTKIPLSERADLWETEHIGERFRADGKKRECVQERERQLRYVQA